jgi:hypothetical protein
MSISVRIDMRMMPRIDEELRGPSHRNKGGAYSKEGEAKDEESML